MRLLITRHGQTIENKLGIFQGHHEGTLTEEGLEQAKRLAERLKEEDIDIIFTSDLNRALNTALEVKKYHPNTELCKTRSLRERNLGTLQNTKKNKYSKKELVKLYRQPPNGESVVEMYNRAKEFHEEVLENYFDKTVLYVTHQGMKNTLLNYILGEEHDKFRKLGNTSVTEISIKNSIDLKVFNCTNHLR